MAYDKVVDSSVLDAGLKQIADAIREKGGTSDNLAFPQAMADAIAAIEAGGGCKVCAGKLVFAEKQNSNYVITHNLGVTPSFAYIQTISPRVSAATNSYQLRLASGWLEETFLAIKDDPNIDFGVQARFDSNYSGDEPYTNRDITDDSSFFRNADEKTITLGFKNYGQLAYAGQVFVYLLVAFEV